MDKQKLEFFRKLLLEEKDRLNEKMDNLKKGEVYVNRDELKDVVDAASDEFDKTFVMRIRDRELKLIKKIDEALVKIDNGTYGYCTECGCEIEEKRLNARPVASLCIACKEEEEEQERRAEKYGK